MNIEINEFYPLEVNKDKSLVTGTIKVRLVDFGIDLLGIFVSKKKNFWLFSLPGRSAKHHETAEKIHYPFFSFENRKQQRSLVTEIRKKGRVFIEQWLANGGSSTKPNQISEQTEIVKEDVLGNESATAAPKSRRDVKAQSSAKETPSLRKSKDTTKIEEKPKPRVYIDFAELKKKLRKKESLYASAN